MSRRGSEVLQFRVAPELRGALQAYATKHGLDNESSAARMILSTVLGMEEGASPKAAAWNAAVNEAIFTASRAMQEVVHGALPEIGASLAAKLMARLSGG